MKTLFISITAFLLAMMLFPFNTVSAQNEIQPQMWFDHASYGTREMTCNPYSTGIISEQGPDYSKATITVTDPGANKYSAAIDRIAVHVWSDSDKKGIEITAYETDVNSGIFKGTVTISEGQSTRDAIHVTDGDTISAKYAGTTPWSLGTAGHGIMTTAFIGMSCPPLERVPASAIQVTDNKGNEQKTITVGKQIQIRSNLTNVTIRNQTFAYIVQVQDKGGAVESLSWISGVLLPSQALGPSVSWTPTEAGKYTVQVFVWQSINNPNSLSPPVSTDLTAWPILSAYPGNTTGYLENRHCQSGYELVIKSGNGSPACVTPETAQKLIERGWGKEITGSATQQASVIQDTPTNVCGQFYTAPGNPPNLRETTALLMGSNSTACARLTFTVVGNFKDCNGPHCSSLARLDSLVHITNVYYEKNGYVTSVTPAKDFTNSFKIKEVPEVVDLSNYSLGSKFTVTYVIKSLPNATGFYDASIPKIVCDSYPLAVGYAPDEVNASDFTYINSASLPCPGGLYQLTGVEISGMNYTEMKLP